MAMTRPIFKAGDEIVPKKFHIGIRNATVIGIDGSNYRLRIARGIAIIPIESQVHYKLKDNDHETD